MLIDGRHQRTIGLADDGLTVRTLDQRLLPHELVWAELRSLEDASEAGLRRLFP
jgi:methylthioribose-1-phosphate isomerase